MAKYILIDNIVESYLLKRGLSVHWYVEVLKHATDAYREIYFDTLGLSRFKEVEVLEGNIIKFPCDYVDYVAVWHKGDKPGQSGKPIIVRRVDRVKERLYLDLRAVFEEGDTVLLEYMTDGSDCDAASRVHPFAQQAIEDFVDWKRSPNHANRFSPEGRNFAISNDNLRARLNDLSVEELEYMIANRGRLFVENCDLLNI